MSQRDDTGFKAFEADGPIALYSRVNLNSDGTIGEAGLAERCIGTLQHEAALAAGDVVTVKLYTAPGTHKVRTVEAVTAGSLLYTEAAGEVQDTDAATSFLWGQALETATAENDIIEAIPFAQTDVAST